MPHDKKLWNVTEQQAMFARFLEENNTEWQNLRL